MMNLRELFSRILNTLGRNRFRDTEAEMQIHFNMEVEAGMRRGLTRAEAERAARHRAGSVTASLETVRDHRSIGWLDGTGSSTRTRRNWFRKP